MISVFLDRVTIIFDKSIKGSRCVVTMPLSSGSSAVKLLKYVGYSVKRNNYILNPLAERGYNSEHGNIYYRELTIMLNL